MRNHGYYGVNEEDDPTFYSARPGLVADQVKYVDHV